jgi:hypothetical protein
VHITPKRVWYITYAIGLLAVLVFSYSFFFTSSLAEDCSLKEEKPREEPSLIPHSFQQKMPLQQSLESSFFSLAAIERPLRLPDLRSFFTFQGCNERPDLSLEKMRVQFTLRGGSLQTVSAGEKVYLRFDSKTNHWMISEKPTCLSAVFKPRDNGVDVTLEIQDEQGNIITNPTEFHQFFLNATAAPSQGAQNTKKWEVGELPAEPALLEKQTARWYGKDMMIQTLGGDEFTAEAERERVQFGSEAAAYVLWVKEGDCFVFNGERWEAAKLGPDTKRKILLRAKKVDEKEMHFDLWNQDGSLHQVCILRRREEKKNNTMPEIKLLGARSQKHWIAEVAGKRIVLSPTDWIVFTEEGAVKIDSEKTLDDYIEGVLSGSLITFSGLNKVNSDSCLIGLFFDAARTAQEEISIPLYRSCTFTDSASKAKAEDDDDDDEDEDDPFFDDEDDDDDD